MKKMLLMVVALAACGASVRTPRVDECTLRARAAERACMADAGFQSLAFDRCRREAEIVSGDCRAEAPR